MQMGEKTKKNLNEIKLMTTINISPAKPKPKMNNLYQMMVIPTENINDFDSFHAFFTIESDLFSCFTHCYDLIIKSF